MDVVVVGGTGFLGARAVAALGRVPGLRVRTAARRGAELRLDLGDPSTFAVLDDADVVVNCADTVLAPPDALARHCVARGQRFVETTAELATIERLLEIDAAPGGLLVGAGLFPGVTDLMAASLLPAEHVTVCVRFSPLSSGGPGLGALVARTLVAPAVAVRGGARAEGRPLRPGPRVPYPDGSVGTVTCGFPEAVLLARGRGVRDVEAVIAPVPNASRLGAYVFGLLPAAILRCLEAPTRWAVTLVRSVLLREVKGHVRLAAVADGRTCWFEAEDGLTATGVAIAAQVALLPELVGTRTIEETHRLDEVIAEMRRIGGEDVIR